MSETSNEVLEGEAATAHTVFTIGRDGSHHVQHFGAGHVVDGSVRMIELRPGETVTIRHLA